MYLQKNNVVLVTEAMNGMYTVLERWSAVKTAHWSILWTPSLDLGLKYLRTRTPSRIVNEFMARFISRIHINSHRNMEWQLTKVLVSGSQLSTFNIHWKLGVPIMLSTRAVLTSSISVSVVQQNANMSIGCLVATDFKRFAEVNWPFHKRLVCWQLLCSAYYTFGLLGHTGSLRWTGVHSNDRLLKFIETALFDTTASATATTKASLVTRGTV